MGGTPILGARSPADTVAPPPPRKIWKKDRIGGIWWYLRKDIDL